MKKALVIQDMSAFGKCSLTAAIPVLSVMGVQACPLPTAIFSAQTAYPSFYHRDLTDDMPRFIDAWRTQQETFDGIYSGFVTGDAQIEHIFEAIETFGTPNTTILIDPVMGDDGELYKMYTPALLARMQELVQHATIITPNLTECCLLTDTSYDKLMQYQETDFTKALLEVIQTLQQQTNARIIVTGIKQKLGVISNVFADCETLYTHETPYNGGSFSGTGDLFSSIILGSYLRGQTIPQAMQLAQTFLSTAIADTRAKPIEGIAFERHLRLLL